jgi:hypothetical protein
MSFEGLVADILAILPSEIFIHHPEVGWTLAILTLLKLHFPFCQDLWRLMDEKGRKFLSSMITSGMQRVKDKLGKKHRGTVSLQELRRAEELATERLSDASLHILGSGLRFIFSKPVDKPINVTLGAAGHGGISVGSMN